MFFTTYHNIRRRWIVILHHDCNFKNFKIQFLFKIVNFIVWGTLCTCVFIDSWNIKKKKERKNQATVKIAQVRQHLHIALKSARYCIYNQEVDIFPPPCAYSVHVQHECINCFLTRNGNSKSFTVRLTQFCLLKKKEANYHRVNSMKP